MPFHSHKLAYEPSFLTLETPLCLIFRALRKKSGYLLSDDSLMNLRYRLFDDPGESMQPKPTGR